MRGEDLCIFLNHVIYEETPPRAWGRLLPKSKLFLLIGNTPTCVGKTVFPTTTMFPVEKHPHVRWEDPLEEMFNPLSQRNTPTCVGKTKAPHGIGRNRKKHPHVRGEDPFRRHRPPHQPETPPRAWGRLAGNIECNRSARNTPTCVGKTAHDKTSSVKAQKHPHVRGEDFYNFFFMLSLIETPPRAWGRPCGYQRSRSHHRNTPTCVGKTSPIFHTDNGI